MWNLEIVEPEGEFLNCMQKFATEITRRCGRVLQRLVFVGDRENGFVASNGRWRSMAREVNRSR